MCSTKAQLRCDIFALCLLHTAVTQSAPVPRSPFSPLPLPIQLTQAQGADGRHGVRALVAAGAVGALRHGVRAAHAQDGGCGVIAEQHVPHRALLSTLPHPAGGQRAQREEPLAAAHAGHVGADVAQDGEGRTEAAGGGAILQHGRVGGRALRGVCGRAQVMDAQHTHPCTPEKASLAWKCSKSQHCTVNTLARCRTI